MANELQSVTLVSPRIIGSPIWAIPRTQLAQESLSAFPVPLHGFRVHDAIGTNLPGTAAADDLGLESGTFGTGSPQLLTTDLKAAGLSTLYARIPNLLVPYSYVAGQTIQLRFYAGMETTVADTTATLDVEAYKVDGEGGVDGSDQCGTAATSINSLTFANKDFDLGSSLVGGDLLDVRIAIAVNDAATGTAVKGAIGKVFLLCDTKG